MIRVIALDEMGQFEKRDTGVRFVGGFSADVEDVGSEKREVEELLEAACQEFNEKWADSLGGMKAYYPHSLHGSGAAFFTEENAEGTDDAGRRLVPVRLTDGPGTEMERQFRRHLEQETMKYLGRKKAALYAFLDPYPDSERQESGLGRSNLLNPGKGANFYERMAVLALYNQVFYSLEPEKPAYDFELATRTLNNYGDDWDNLYEVYRNASGSVKSTITNTSTYKTALATLLYEKALSDKYLDAAYYFHVNSVNYTDKEKSTPILYIADIVCGYIRKKLQQAFSVNLRTSENRVTAGGLTSFCKRLGIQIRIYDECDAAYRQMVEYVKKGELGRYYAEKYELTHGNGVYKDFYLNYWVPQLEAYLADTLLKEEAYAEKVRGMVPEYVTFADGFMGPRETAYEKGLYVAECLSGIVEGLDRYRSRKAMLFRIYDIALRGYNHRGALDASRLYIEKCEACKGDVGIEEYVSHMLRALVFYCNFLRFDEALSSGLLLDKTARQLKAAYEVFYSASCGGFDKGTCGEASGSGVRLRLAGKVFSTMGQIYGFKGQYEMARQYFCSALQEFDGNSDDHKITMSHLLQLFISNGKKAEYESYAPAYFGENGLREQLKKAFDTGDGGFMILIYVKAFNLFYAKDKENLPVLEELLGRTENRADDCAHPWELIYKNLFECLLQQKELFGSDKYKYLKEKVFSCVVKPDATIRLILLHARMSFMELQEQGRGSALLADCLEEEEAELCRQFFGDVRDMSWLEFRKLLDEKITYAYR